jgi:hypothetical protein
MVLFALGALTGFCLLVAYVCCVASGRASRTEELIEQ